MTPDMDSFISAVTSGDLQKVEEMLKDQPSLAELHAPSGESVIQSALYRGNAAVVALLLATNPKIDFATACSVGDLDLVKTEVAANPSVVNELSGDGFLPFCLAGAFGHPTVVEYLLENQANPNLRSKALGVAPLDSAIFGRNVEVIRLLLTHGANPNIPQGGGFRPLHGAAQNGQDEVVKLLLSHGADPSAKDDKGRTAADLAREHNHPETANLLSP